jgi:hypothetical protein
VGGGGAYWTGVKHTSNQDPAQLINTCSEGSILNVALQLIKQLFAKPVRGLILLRHTLPLLVL